MCLYLLIFALFTQWISILSYDLCSNSRIDSIAYIDDTKQYFITSGGHYWLVKENEMPPKTGGKPMPDGWRGDASAYINTLKGCEMASSKLAKEQQVLVLENDMYKLFDVRSLDWIYSGKHFEYNKINRIHIDWTKPVDAMFDLNMYEVYIVQGDSYAGADWSKLCTGLTDLAEAYIPDNARIAFETNKKIDGIMFKHGIGLYVFTGDEYYIMPLDMNMSRRGKILRTSKGSIKSVRTDFFNCSGSVPVKPPVPPETTGDDIKQIPGHSDTTLKPDESVNEDENKGGSKALWIIIAIVLLLIVVAVVAILAFMALRKRKTVMNDYEVKSSKSNTSAKSAKNTPSKFDRMAATSTASSKKSYRSKIYK